MESSTQNDILYNKLMQFYNVDDNLEKMLQIINGKSKISLRIVDWFATNYSKKNYTVYEINKNDEKSRFKVYNDYKLKLKAYSKKRFDPFFRWERINVPYGQDTYIQTTLGQLNFFKWAIENEIIKYIETNYDIIERDMNQKNKSTKNVSISSTDSDMSISSVSSSGSTNSNNKTRKKREELSLNASRSIKKEFIPVVVSFS